MSNLIRSLLFTLNARSFSLSSNGGHNHFKLIIAGGGTAGASSAHNFDKKLEKGQIAVIEPSDMHYNQSMWTLVGGGIKQLEKTGIPMNEALPKSITRFSQKVSSFDADNNALCLENGTKLTYDYLIVALGIRLNFDQIPGALEALKHDVRVTSNYSINTVSKTFESMKKFDEGNAFFTFPNTPVKCAGAAQKIMYLFDEFLRKEKKRSSSKIEYCTSLPVIFPVNRYAEALLKICKSRDIGVKTRTNLIEVDPLKHVATFVNLDTQEKRHAKYNFLHITPPMGGYDVVKNSKLGDKDGFVTVNSETLQHSIYPNVFGIGDCSNLPTSKTAAAVAAQQNVLFVNLYSLMKGAPVNILKYNGYTSCPFVTSYNKVILAEFGYNGEIMETFPYNQTKESRFAYFLKAYIMPQLYWHGLIRGKWNGPSTFRKFFHLGMTK